MFTIAIDGPSGAGKSTAANGVSKKLGITYLDTGAMYRALGLKALQLGIEPGNAAEVEPILSSTSVEVLYENGTQKIFLDGVDVSGQIREHKVSKAASDISAIPAVRIKLVELQREIAGRQSCVLDGRDIGTYVLPDASHKFFLTADPEERAVRRHKELTAKGQTMTYEQVLSDIIMRDKNDSSRAFAPLKQADDAVLLDTTHMTADEVVDSIVSFVKKDGK